MSELLLCIKGRRLSSRNGSSTAVDRQPMHGRAESLHGRPRMHRRVTNGLHAPERTYRTNSTDTTPADSDGTPTLCTQFDNTSGVNTATAPPSHPDIASPQSASTPRSILKTRNKRVRFIDEDSPAISDRSNVDDEMHPKVRCYCVIVIFWRVAHGAMSSVSTYLLTGYYRT